MLLDEVCGGIIGAERTGEHKPDIPLLQDVRSDVARAGLEPSIGAPVEPKAGLVEHRRLPGIADEELEVIDAFDRTEIAHGPPPGENLKPFWQ